MTLDKDVELDEEESIYECYRCGTVIRTETYPGDCEDCGSEFRHRGFPME